MDSFEIEAAVIGAGVVGLAAARALARSGVETLLLERNPRFGEETSARNSEVIHAGIYYAPGSLKAQLCLEGRERLYEYAQARGITHRRCGKLIVACASGEEAALETLLTQGHANGVSDLTAITGAEAMQMEPALLVTSALHSPSTGVIDSHAFMLAMLGDLEDAGGQLVCNSPVIAGELQADGRIALQIGGAAPMRLIARHVILAAGLWSQALTRQIAGLPDPPPLALVKGNYFTLQRSNPFSRLIYPCPVGGGLGVHVTLDTAGRAKFGPDTEWLETDNPEAVDYTVDPARQAQFERAIRRYWPGLPDGALAPGYSGVRPKIAGAEYPDFVVQGPADHGLEGHVLIYGVESPGLTSALAIGARAVSAALGHENPLPD